MNSTRISNNRRYSTTCVVIRISIHSSYECRTLCIEHTKYTRVSTWQSVVDNITVRNCMCCDSFFLAVFSQTPPSPHSHPFDAKHRTFYTFSCSTNTVTAMPFGNVRVRIHGQQSRNVNTAPTHFVRMNTNAKAYAECIRVFAFTWTT